MLCWPEMSESLYPDEDLAQPAAGHGHRATLAATDFVMHAYVLIVHDKNSPRKASIDVAISSVEDSWRIAY
jgi:hypothetical protein